jgi:hypothetical protein
MKSDRSRELAGMRPDFPQAEMYLLRQPKRNVATAVVERKGGEVIRKVKEILRVLGITGTRQVGARNVRK